MSQPCRHHLSFAALRLQTFRTLFCPTHQAAASSIALHHDIRHHRASRQHRHFHSSNSAAAAHKSSRTKRIPRIRSIAQNHKATALLAELSDLELAFDVEPPTTSPKTNKNHDLESQSSEPLSSALPRSPLHLKHTSFVSKARKPKARAIAGEEELRHNPWARILSSPVRMCNATMARLPEKLLVPWGLMKVKDEEVKTKGAQRLTKAQKKKGFAEGKLWFLPLGLTGGRALEAAIREPTVGKGVNKGEWVKEGNAASVEPKKTETADSTANPPPEPPLALTTKSAQEALLDRIRSKTILPSTSSTLPQKDAQEPVDRPFNPVTKSYTIPSPTLLRYVLSGFHNTSRRPNGIRSKAIPLLFSLRWRLATPLKPNGLNIAERETCTMREDLVEFTKGMYEERVVAALKRVVDAEVGRGSREVFRVVEGGMEGIGAFNWVGAHLAGGVQNGRSVTVFLSMEKARQGVKLPKRVEKDDFVIDLREYLGEESIKQLQAIVVRSGLYLVERDRLVLAVRPESNRVVEALEWLWRLKIYVDAGRDGL